MPGERSIVGDWCTGLDARVAGEDPSRVAGDRREEPGHEQVLTPSGDGVRAHEWGLRTEHVFATLG